MNAVARRGDPSTSWDAARSIGPDTLRESQQAVLAILQALGPMTDDELILRVEQSPSGARTRRAELTALGLVHDTGKRARLGSGRHAIVWAAGSGPKPPPDPNAPGLWDDLP